VVYVHILMSVAFLHKEASSHKVMIALFDDLEFQPRVIVLKTPPL